MVTPASPPDRAPDRADAFIRYSSYNVEAVVAIAGQVEEAGVSIWRDRDRILGGVATGRILAAVPATGGKMQALILALVLGGALAGGCPLSQADEPGQPPTLSAKQRRQLAERDRCLQKSQELRAEDKLAEAISEAAQALDLELQVHGAALDPGAQTWEQLARWYAEGGDFPAAQKLLQQVQLARGKARGDKHWLTADVRRVRGDLDTVATWPKEKQQRYRETGLLAARVLMQTRKGKIDEAFEDARALLRIREDLWGDLHPEVATSLYSLGILHRRKKDYGQAEDYLKQARTRFEKSLGGNHPRCAMCLADLAFVHELRKDPEQAEKAYRRAAEVYAATVGKRTLVYIECLDGLCSVYLGKKDHAQAAAVLREWVPLEVEVLGEESPSVAGSAMTLGHLLESRSDRDGAEKNYLLAERTFARLGEQYRARHLLCLWNLAALSNDKGEKRKAREYLLKARELAKGQLRATEPLYAGILNDLGFVCLDLGDYATAESAFQEVLDGRLEKPVKEDELLARAYENLAMAHSIQGVVQGDKKILARAKDHYLSTAEIRKRLLGEENFSYAWTLAQLGSVYWALGEFPRAEATSLAAVKVMRAAKKEATPQFRSALTTLGQAYLSQDDYSKAKATWLEVVALKEKALGEKDPEFLLALGILGGVYLKAREYGEAETVFRRLLEIRRRTVGEGHADFAGALEELGFVYEARRELLKARDHYQRAVAIRKKPAGQEDAPYANAVLKLGQVYTGLSDYTRAEAAIQEALAIFRKTPGEAHPDFAGALMALGLLHHARGDNTRAKKSFAEALPILKKAWGDDDDRYLARLHQVATVYHSMGEDADAEKLLVLLVEKRSQRYEPQHPQVAQVLESLGLVYEAQRNFVEAERVLSRALAIYGASRGKSHPDYARTLGLLGSLHGKRRDFPRAIEFFRAAAAALKASGKDEVGYAEAL